jgi:DNA-binding MarR family transcriptional regulator
MLISAMRASTVQEMTFKELNPDPDGEFTVAVPEYFFYLLNQAARLRDAALDAAVEPEDFTASRVRILAIIRRVDGCTMSALARFSSIDRTTLTREIDYLVSRGLVARTVPPKDRRRVNLALTAEGEKFYETRLSSVVAVSRRSVRGVDMVHLRDFARTLQAIIRNLVDDPDWAEEIIAFARSDRLRPIGSSSPERQGQVD